MVAMHTIALLSHHTATGGVCLLMCAFGNFGLLNLLETSIQRRHTLLNLGLQHVLASFVREMDNDLCTCERGSMFDILGCDMSNSRSRRKDMPPAAGCPLLGDFALISFVPSVGK